MSVKRPEQHLFFQLYMNRDRTMTEKVVRELQSKGFSAVMLTVDAAMPGKRELDQRTIGEWEGPAANGKASSDSKGIAHVGGYSWGL
jgi:L-lactate dehydrogenase (cytochrome)